jgi:stress response protein SCP2
VIELTRGQELDLTRDDGTPHGKLRMGLGWDKKHGAGYLSAGVKDVDLDASAIQFSGGKLFDLAFFNHLETRDGSVVHLGDNLTGRGEGDDEVITIDLGKVWHSVDTMLFLVSSYQGQTLEWVNSAYCRITDEDDTELARYTLTEGVPRTGFMMAKMTRDGDDPSRWRLTVIGQGIPVTVPTESLDVLARFA